MQTGGQTANHTGVNPNPRDGRDSLVQRIEDCGVVVVLGESELRLAATVGVEREIATRRREIPDRASVVPEPWDRAVNDASAEIATARVIGRFWPAIVNPFSEGPDLPDRVFVRRTATEYRLPIFAEDDDEGIFVLAVGVAPKIHVVGWIRGKDGKRAGWLDKAEGVYRVPWASLTPIKAREAKK